jgi:hypothetical protein
MVTKAGGTVSAIYPNDRAVALVWTVGFYAMVFGYLLFALGFRLHSLGERINAALA